MARARPAAAADGEPGRIAIAHRVMTARQQLLAAGISSDSADLDARLLAQHLLGWTTDRFLMASDQLEPDGFGAAYEALIRRRCTREPLAYIVGHREFWGLDIEVTPAVLIPRPETELLVEAFLEQFPGTRDRLAVADICTGSGCVAVAIARERPGAQVLATDISARALAIARRNARRHDVAGPVQFVCADLLRGIAGQFDAIVANPPYVPQGARPALSPEVGRHEPAVALFAGDDGLAVIERLAAQAAGRLRKGGVLMFEFGYDHSEAVTQVILSTPGLELLTLRQDLQGIPRVAVVLGA
jgi:release factor glutamine methyltransferase